ncbi:MAG: 30S ribosomal protein S15 [Nanoarchaeota archaeon]|nr:30S ribosomal protein S15 [Nanoarchaeota archaeon]
MARMHARKKGKSSSTKPLRPDSSWVKYKKKDVEQIIIKYAKKDQSPAQIGLTLRDEYGVPNVKDIIGKTINQILEENKIIKKVPYDMLALMKRAVKLREHLTNNKKDLHSKRGLNLIESKIKRLTKYYIKTEKIARDWRYNPEEAKLLIE